MSVIGFVNMRSSVCEILKSHFIHPLEPSKTELITELFLCPLLPYESLVFLLTRMLRNTVKGTLTNVLCTESLMEKLGKSVFFQSESRTGPTCQALLLVGPDHSVSQHLQLCSFSLNATVSAYVFRSFHVYLIPSPSHALSFRILSHQWHCVKWPYVERILIACIPLSVYLNAFI